MGLIARPTFSKLYLPDFSHCYLHNLSFWEFRLTDPPWLHISSGGLFSAQPARTCRGATQETHEEDATGQQDFKTSPWTPGKL